ncbi:MAG: glycosyltransferase family 4 protein [Spirochaetes bacterium]|nr:glycosyltransferase family 4 protein [Spirochaetota bacterium]
MKILLLNYEFPPIGGGAGNATHYILNEFSKNKNIEIDLVTSSVSDFKIKEFSQKIYIHYLDIGKNGNLHFQTNKELLLYSWKAYKYSKQLIKKKEFDLIHAFFGIPCGYIAMKLKLPYIVSLRGSDVPSYNKRFKIFDKFIFKRLNKKIWNNAKLVIANSQGLRELALQSSPAQDISVIYNGVNVDEFKQVKKNKINKKITLISTGRLIQRKGYEYLIRALKDLDDIQLNLIGDGDIKSHLEGLSKKLNVDVNFVGKKNHNEIKKYLQQADIFILPSLNEGMSNSALEAMACGLPIVVTDVGGSKELINHNGFIVQKASVDSIKCALNKYLSNKKLIIDHGLKSRKIAEKMSWKKAASDYEEAYQSV